MNEEALLELFNEYTKKNSFSIDNIQKIYFKEIIDKILIIYNKEKASLEAKIYTYEKIIASSNFLPVLLPGKSHNIETS